MKLNKISDKCMICHHAFNLNDQVIGHNGASEIQGKVTRVFQEGVGGDNDINEIEVTAKEKIEHISHLNCLPSFELTDNKCPTCRKGISKSLTFLDRLRMVLTLFF